MSRRRRGASLTAAGLALGWVADQVLGDPRRWHPVAGFGRVAAGLERVCWADDRAHGVGYVVVLVGGTVALGAMAQRAASGPAARVLATAAATWTVLGGRTLARESSAIARFLDDGDLDAARHRLRSLVSRDPESLDADEIARAALESVAENTSDAVVAPLVWGAIAGIPGLLGYRAVNTLDAMVGYRNERYGRFGWAAARLDDVVNWVPARLCSGLAIVLAPVVGGRPGVAWRAVREQSGQHPSPNGGVVEAAFAGGLGVRIGGSNVYGGVVEDRGELGYGPRPRPADLARANRLALAVSAASALVTAVAAAAIRR